MTTVSPLPEILRSKSGDRHLYAVGRVRALETRLLDRDILRDLIEAKDLKEVFEELRDTVYGEAVMATESTLDFEQMLAVETHNLIHLIDTISPDPELTDLFVYRFDIQNLKILLKANLAKATEPQSLYTLGRFGIRELRELIEKGESLDLPRWTVAAVSEVRQCWKESPELYIVDAVLDRALLLAQLSGAQKSKRPILIQLFYYTIDATNVETFIRMRIAGRPREQFDAFFVPGGELDKNLFQNAWETGIRELGRHFEKTPFHLMVVKSLEEYQMEGSLTMLGVEGARLLIEHLSEARYITFGPEPILAYLATRLFEIKILRLICVSKKNNLPVEDLRKRVMTYYA